MEPWLVIFILGEMAFIIFLVWIGSNFVIKRRNLRSEERLKILGRFASGEELTHFLGSEPGRMFLETFAERPDPRRAIARTVQIAVVLAFLGFGFLALSFFLSKTDWEAYFIPGILLTMACLGALVGAVVSARLVRGADRKPQS